MRLNLIILVILLFTGQVTLAASFKTQVAAGTDDAKTYNNNLSTSDIDAVLGFTGEYYCDYLARFTDVTVPSGATIDSAFLSLHCSSSQSGTTCNAIICAEDTNSAAAFSTWNDYDNRHLTGSSTAWNDIGAHTLLTWYRTPDIKNIIQEVVNRGSWSSGQAVAVFIQDNNSDAGAFRRFYQYERPVGDGASACSLLVFYTEGTPGEYQPRRRRNTMNLSGDVKPRNESMYYYANMMIIDSSKTGRQNEQGFIYNRAVIPVREYLRRRDCE
ncbi:MAG: hypothetical protein JXA92_02490 [candidate division Zixibacteria bacterium]|nr:hypothetical protein [candidate division Zixibacteria bacterium]